MSPSRPKPSPALVISCIALFVALGGTGYAAATGAIDSREIRNNTIRGKDVKNSSLTGADAKSDSLTGSDIRESGLGKVPGAGRADRADTAATATSAADATRAGNADLLGGVPPSGYQQKLGVVVRRKSVSGIADNAVGVVTADCQPGERATGGGTSLSGAQDDATVIRTYPSDRGTEVGTLNGAVPEAWTSRVLNTSGGSTTLQGFVVCATP